MMRFSDIILIAITAITCAGALYIGLTNAVAPVKETQRTLTIGSPSSRWPSKTFG